MATISLQSPEQDNRGPRVFYGRVTGAIYRVNQLGEVTVDTQDAGDLLANGWRLLLGASTPRTWTASFTTPADSTPATVYKARMLGGGAVGGSTGASAGLSAAGGGGAGAYVEHLFSGIAPGTLITFTVGAGGIIGVNNGDGGDSSIDALPGIVAGGGKHGVTSNTADTPTLGGDGGTVTGSPTLGIAGGKGFPGMTNGTTAFLGGYGAGSPFGTGGAGASGGISGDGAAGTVPGTGGGGAIASNFAGGAGAGGKITVEAAI